MVGSSGTYPRAWAELLSLLPEVIFIYALFNDAFVPQTM